MNLEKLINKVFTLDDLEPVSDEFIEENSDVLWDTDHDDYMRLVPNYMLWCIRNSKRYDSLVMDNTISALAEFGRSNKPSIKHLNFKFSCNIEQRNAVLEFLNWSLSAEIIIHEIQLKRACKNWN